MLAIAGRSSRTEATRVAVPGGRSSFWLHDKVTVLNLRRSTYPRPLQPFRTGQTRPPSGIPTPPHPTSP
jgi:hypothetical protein